MALERDRISGKNVLDLLDQTAQSVILYDGEGRRQINVDLKDVQETPYPQPALHPGRGGLRPAGAVQHQLLAAFPRAGAASRASAWPRDVHAISDLNDPYNADFMRAASILFMSHEWLPVPPGGMGAPGVGPLRPGSAGDLAWATEGALLAVKKDNFIERIPAVRTRPVVNTIGAGDALFSAFLHGYVANRRPLPLAAQGDGVCLV